MENEYVYNDLNVNQENLGQKSPNKGKILWIVGGIVLLLVLAVIFFFLYIKLNLTAEKFIDKNVKKANNWIATVFGDYDKNTYDDVISKGNIKIATNDTDLKDLNKLSIDYTANVASKKDYSEITIDLKNDNKSVMKGSGIIDKSNITFESTDIYPSPLKYQLSKTIEINDNLKNINIEDLEQFFQNTIKNFGEALKEANNKTKTKGLNVIYTYEITKDNANKVIDKFMSLMKEEKLYKLLDIEDVDTLDLQLDDFENIKLTLDMNALTGKLNNFTFIVGNEEYKSEKLADNKFRVGDVVIEYTDDSLTITGSENNEELGSVMLKSNKKEGTSIAVKTDEFNIQLNTLIKEDKTTLTLNMEANDLRINVDGNETKKGNNSDIDFNVKLILNNKEYTINLTGQNEYGNNLVNAKEIKNAKDVNNLTEEDQMLITTNLMSKLSQIEIISSILESLSATDDFNEPDNNIEISM